MQRESSIYGYGLENVRGVGEGLFESSIYGYWSESLRGVGEGWFVSWWSWIVYNCQQRVGKEVDVVGLVVLNRKIGRWK